MQAPLAPQLRPPHAGLMVGSDARGKGVTEMKINWQKVLGAFALALGLLVFFLPFLAYWNLLGFHFR